jgi:hypothetical protein
VGFMHARPLLAKVAFNIIYSNLYIFFIFSYFIYYFCFVSFYFYFLIIIIANYRLFVYSK